MFVAGEDFYFLAYTTLLILDELDCHSPAKLYRDIRGIAYVADIIGHESDLKLAISEKPLSLAQISRLSLLYDRAVARRAPFERVIAALAERGLIELVGSDPKGAYLKADARQLQLDDDIFAGERGRISQLRRVSRLSIAGKAKVQERLFQGHGVRTWDD